MTEKDTNRYNNFKTGLPGTEFYLLHALLRKKSDSYELLAMGLSCSSNRQIRSHFSIFPLPAIAISRIEVKTKSSFLFPFLLVF